jgi:hypothetical protein
MDTRLLELGRRQPPKEMVAEGSPEPYQFERPSSGCGAKDTMLFLNCMMTVRNSRIPGIQPCETYDRLG